VNRLGALALLALFAFAVSRSPIRAQDADSSGTIGWHGGPDGVIEAADRENRPVLIAIATLANGAGNEGLATRLRDANVVATAESFVSVVASRHQHGAGPECERFGGKCADHQAVMAWVVARFGTDIGSLTAPRQLILHPDGTVLARLPFGIAAAALRRELETALAATAPRRALALAVSSRRAAIDSIRAGTTDPIAYSKTSDPLAASVLLHLWQTDTTNRPRWAAALAALPPEAFIALRFDLRRDASLIAAAKSIDARRGAWWERFHGKERSEAVPAPHDPELAAAFAKLQKRDASALEPLLDALSHPVNGPEVRAALVGLVGRDLGSRPEAWRKELAR